MMEFTATKNENPFPGLLPFETNEYYLFFGREGQSDELLERLQRTRFLAVVGTSGSGKSSLIRAGLLPALYGGLMAKAGSAWRVALFRPGNDPIGNLARELGKESALGASGQDAEVQTTIIETTLRRSTLGLVDAVRQARLDAHENLLVVADQFEELFRFKETTQESGTEDAAAAFVKLLLEASAQRDVPIYVVLTMRSDFLGDCAQFWGLPEAINTGQYLIPRMTRDERHAAITGPVAVGGGEITVPLVNRLLNDMGDNPDHLPTLQHALMRTWDYWTEHRRNGEPVGLPHYEAIGGMNEALSLHADEAFNELNERQQLIAERMFKALTEKGTDNREIRRPTSLQEICEIAGATEDEAITVIDVFRREGRSFLMPPAGNKLDAESVIDISHESLIRNWDRLQKWADEEAQSARIYRRIAESAELNLRGKESLWRDPQLQLALDWRDERRPNKAWARRYHQHFYIAMDFLKRSAAERDAVLAAERERERRELEQTRAFATQQARAARRLRWLTATMCLILLLALGATAFALKAQADAEQSKRRTQNSERNAIAAKEEAERQRVVAEGEKKTADEQKLIAAELAEKEKKANERLKVALAAAEKAKDDARTEQKKAEKLRDDAIAARDANRQYRNAWTSYKQARYDDGRQKFKDAAAKFEKIGDFGGAGASYLDLADFNLFLSKRVEGNEDEKLVKEGLANFDRAIPAFRRVNDRDGEAAVLVSKGVYFIANPTAEVAGGDPKVKGENRAEQGIGLLKQALTLYEDTGNDEARNNVLIKLGDEFIESDDVEKKKEGLDYYSKTLPLYRKRQKWGELKSMMLKLASHYRNDVEDGDEEKKYLEEAIKIYEDTNDPPGKVKTLTEIMARFGSDTPEFSQYLEGALQAIEEIQKPAYKAGALKDVASVYMGESYGNSEAFRKGLDYYEKVIKVYADADLRKEQADLLVQAAQLTSGYSRTAEEKKLAPEFYRRALLIYRKLGDPKSEAAVLQSLGFHHESSKQFPEAIDYYKQKVALPGIESDSQARLYYRIARLQERLEQWAGAIESLRRALAIYQAQDYPSNQADTLVQIGNAQVRLNQLAQSLETFKQAAALEPARNYKALQANALLRRGEAEEMKKQLPQALESYRQALAFFKEIDGYEDKVKQTETKIQNLMKSMPSPPQ